jgi:NADPH-dependent 2,4-dienoyl-CoA reductase/sulfur reductase-like enzyme
LLGTNKNIVIIGGNDAGLAAAGRAGRLKPDLPVLVFEKSRNVAYASCGLPFFIAGQISASSVQGLKSNELLQKKGIKVFTEHEVLELNVPDKHLLVRDIQKGSISVISFHKLIITAGAKPIIPQEIADCCNVFTLRNFSDAKGIDDFITQNARPRVLVLGGGYVGLEMADSCTQRGCHVTLVESSGTLAGLPDDLSLVLAARLESRSVSLHMNVKTIEWQKSTDKITGFRLDSRSPFLPIEMVFVAVGIQPNSALAKKAGLQLGVANAIHVNRYQQTSKSNIFAAGDCCETIQLVNGENAWLPLAGSAARQGRVAGENAVGGAVQFPGALGTRMLQVFGTEIGQTGLTFSEALSSGLTPRQTNVRQAGQSEYMPGSRPVDMQIIWDVRSKRVLGGVVMGESGAGYRLNYLAIVVQAQMTIKELVHLDLGYTPAINHLMDPLHIAGSLALKSKRENQ